MVYAMALSHDKPLRYLSKSRRNKRHKPGFYELDTESTEFNQIKFVSKQLWRESAGLEVKHNKLLFCTQPASTIIRRKWSFNMAAAVKHGPDTDDGTALLLRFINSCHPSWTSSLRKIYVRSAPEPCKEEDEYYGYSLDLDLETTRALFKICRTHPKMDIFVEISGFAVDFGSIKYFLLIAWQAAVFHNLDILDNLVFLREYVEEITHTTNWDPKGLKEVVYELSKDEEDQVPVNWRHIPQGEFKEESFREEINKTGWKPYLDEIMAIARFCHETGL